MVQHVGVADVARLVGRVGTDAFLLGLVAYLEEDFRRWEAFEKTSRLASHSPTGVIELMPISDGVLYAFKYVNGHPANTGAGLLTVTGLGVLADVATGYPVLLCEMTIATALRTAATSVLLREDGIDEEPFLIALAEALVLSGLAMATAGSSRPCSGSDHEILHAIDHLFPGTAHHGELAGAASLFTSFLRGDEAMVRAIDACLCRHGLPRTPADLGLTAAQFAQAVHHAPMTRPDRYTVLEHLALDEAGVRDRVDAFVAAVPA